MKKHYDWASRKQNEKGLTRTLCGMKDPTLKLETVLRVKDVECRRCLKILKVEQ